MLGHGSWSPPACVLPLLLETVVFLVLDGIVLAIELTNAVFEEAQLFLMIEICDFPADELELVFSEGLVFLL